MGHSELISLGSIYDLVFKKKNLSIPKEVMAEVQRSYSFLESFSASKIIYGINTGFGPMAQYRIDDKALMELQYNIIRSHSVGAGKPLEPIYVRAAMLSRLYTFLQGKSGVHPELVNLIVSFINNEIYPFIPEHGSVGASGDLVQLAHMALTFIGEGEVFYKGQLKSTAQVLQEVGLKPFSMRIREGLSVTNGTSVMTGIGLVNLIYARKLLQWSILASVLVNEVFSSYDDFMAEELNNAKRHKGQSKIAEAMRNVIAGSKCIRKREVELYSQKREEQIFTHKVQPYYSLRCVPKF